MGQFGTPRHQKIPLFLVGKLSWRDLNVQLRTTLEELGIEWTFVLEYMENDVHTVFRGSIDSLYFCEFSPT